MLKFATLKTSLGILAVLAISAGQARAVSTSFWLVDSFPSLSSGRATATSILREGAVVLAPAFERRAVPGSQYVWGAVPGPGGAIYAVSGTPGRLHRIDDGGSVVLSEDEVADYPALAVSPSGDVFVGTSPGGVVYRVTGDGEREVFFDTGQGYVWSMVYSREHGLVVGTGDSACVFVVAPDGTGRAVHRSSDASVTSLAAVGGRVFAGTAPEAVLLDVTPGDDSRVLFDSRYEEIPGIAVDGRGRVFFAATTVSFEDVLGPGDEFGAGFGEGSVYALTEAGGAVEVWYSADAPITALGGGSDGSVWVGTGLRGRVHAVGADGETGVVTELDDEQVLAIVRSGDGVLISSGLSAAVYESGKGTAESGTYESDVLDASAAAFWGELSWKADVPAGAGVVLSTRSGNTDVPGDAWSEWAPVRGSGEGRIESPPARRLQWKAELAGGRGGSPVLRSVEAAYVRENLPPRVGPVVVYEPGEIATNGGGLPSQASQTLPSGVEVSYSLDAQGGRTDGVPALLRGVRTAEWDALDPNGDALEFEVWMRSDEESDWKLVADGLDRTLHTWDSTSMPDGRYGLRVVASDRPGNPSGGAASAEAASSPFVVDNSPPAFGEIDVTADGTAVRVRGEVADDWTQIRRVEVALDYGEWEEAGPSDGSYDSKSEGFEASVEAPPDGERAVAVRAVDRAGNVAVVRKVLK
ncbi:MAG: hypothetical protein ABIG03_04215 [Candidatus Eisenbacteria bacterium]